MPQVTKIPTAKLAEISRALSSYPEGPERDALTIKHLYGPEIWKRRGFIESHFKIEHKTTGKLVNLHLNHVQRQIEAWRIRQERKRRPARAVILKSRHHGVSTQFLAYDLELVIRGHLVKAAIIAQDDETARKLLDDAKLMRDHLPWRLPIRLDNRSALYFDEPIRGQIDIMSAMSRHGVGRGKHYRFQHMTEVAFWPDFEKLFVALSQNIPYDAGTMQTLETTANGAGGAFHRFWMDTVEGKNDFTAMFYSWLLTPDLVKPVDDALRSELRETITDEEKYLQREHAATWEQLAWRRYAVENLCAGSLDYFHQEYPSTPTEAFISTGQPAFSAPRLSKALLQCEEPQWEGRIFPRRDGLEQELVAEYEGPLKIWARPEKDRVYVMGSDTAEGKEGGDNSAVIVMDVRSGCQVAEYADNQLNPDEFGKLCVCLGRHYNEAWYLPEVNAAGAGTLQAAQNLQYDNILRQPVYGKAGQVIDRRWGWRTRAESKYLLEQRIHSDLSLTDDGEFHISSKWLVRELLGCQKIPSKSFEAPKGAHDDRVIAWGLCVIGRELVWEEEVVPEPEPERRSGAEAYRDRVWQRFDEEVEASTRGDWEDPWE